MAAAEELVELYAPLIVADAASGAVLVPPSSPSIVRVGCTLLAPDEGLGATDERSAYATATMDVPVERAIVPLLTDVVIVSANSQAAKSAWAAEWINITHELAVATEGDRLASVARLPPPGRILDLLLSEPTRIVLVTAAQFSESSRVAVGGVMCTNVSVSSDRRYLSALTPPLEALCPPSAPRGSIDRSTDCGYQRLDITSADPRQADFSCPPFCPGLYPGTLPYPKAARWLTPAVPQPSALPVPADATRASAGLYYTGSCVRAGFTDPASGACTNSSHAEFLRCAFGSGGTDCVQCPRGAMCPGGRRAWPLPGYYAASETSVDIVECSPPQGRCLGWQPERSASGCGLGFRPHSFGCMACDTGFFGDDVGACVRCPGNIDAWKILQPILVFLGCLLAVVIAFYCVLAAIAKSIGGTVAGGAARMLEFASWSVTVVQLISQVGQAAAPGLPAVTRTAYAAVNVFQFEGVAVPPACLSSYPFMGQVVQFSIVLVTLAATLLLIPKVRSSELQRKLRLRLARPLFTILLLLYPGVANAALRLVACTRVELTPQAYGSLNADGDASIKSDGLVAVLVVTDNPFFVCYEGQHRAAGIYAWVIVCVYVISYPLATLLWVRHRIRTLASLGATRNGDEAHAMIVSGTSPAVGAPSEPAEQMGGKLPHEATQVTIRALAKPKPAAVDTNPAIIQHPTLAPFTAGDYRASAYWFRHVDLAAMLWLSMVLVFWRHPQGAPAVLGKAAVTVACPAVVLVAMWRVRPYPSNGAWKLPVRTLALLLTALAAAANAATAMEGTAGGSVTNALGLTVTAGAGTLLITLLGAFGYSAVVGAREEQATVRAAEALKPSPQVHRHRHSSVRSLVGAPQHPPLVLESAAARGGMAESRGRQSVRKVVRLVAATHGTTAAIGVGGSGGNSERLAGEGHLTAAEFTASNPLWNKHGLLQGQATRSRRVLASQARTAREGRVSFLPSAGRDEHHARQSATGAAFERRSVIPGT